MQVFGCAWKINFPEMLFSWPCVLVGLTRKWFEVKIFTPNHFRTHAQRERERDRTQITPWTQSPSTSHPLTSPTATSNCTKSHPSTSLANPKPRSHLRLHWDHTPGSHWDNTDRTEIAIEKWLGFDEFDRICVYLLRNCIIYLFGSWENVRNKKKMCFLYYFQQHNQTLENIFQSIFWNATKHLKIFSFPENSISRKYFT